MSRVEKILFGGAWTGAVLLLVMFAYSLDARAQGANRKPVAGARKHTPHCDYVQFAQAPPDSTYWEVACVGGALPWDTAWYQRAIKP